MGGDNAAPGPAGLLSSLSLRGEGVNDSPSMSQIEDGRDHQPREGDGPAATASRLGYRYMCAMVG